MSFFRMQGKTPYDEFISQDCLQLKYYYRDSHLRIYTNTSSGMQLVSTVERGYKQKDSEVKYKG